MRCRHSAQFARKGASKHVYLIGGLSILGVSTYAFQLFAGRELGDAAYAPFGVFWMLVFLVCPGVFFPFEQELSRAVASRIARNESIQPIVRIASIAYAVICLSALLIAIPLNKFISERFFESRELLLVALIVSFVGYGGMYIVRGVLAGAGLTTGYGIAIGAEGIFRISAIVVLLSFQSITVEVLASIVAIGPYLVAGVGVMFLRTLPKHLQPCAARWRDLTTAIGALLVASACVQVLTNIGPVVVQYLLRDKNKDAVGAFTKAVILTRIPVFLFQAIQAVLLPRLSAAAAIRDYRNLASGMKQMLILVLSIGIASTIFFSVFGLQLLRVFGSDDVLSSSDLLLLALSSAAFIIAMTYAQGLIALSQQRATALAWAIGLVVFSVSCLLPFQATSRVGMALLLGSIAAMCSQFALYRLAVSNAEQNHPTIEVEP